MDVDKNIKEFLKYSNFVIFFYFQSKYCVNVSQPLIYSEKQNLQYSNVQYENVNGKWSISKPLSR